jgi:hypothetical protein
MEQPPMKVWRKEEFKDGREINQVSQQNSNVPLGVR